MKISSANALVTSRALAATGPAKGPALSAPDKSLVSADAAKALSSPSLANAGNIKEQARQKVQQIVERLKILRKLFAADPKQMARALAQIFKELKAAVQAYAKAGGEELGLAADAAGAATAPPSAKDPATANPPPTSAAADDPSAAAAPSGDHALYDAVLGETRKMIGEDGLDFIKLVRSASNEISDLLDTARTQARGRKQDKETDKAIEDADKSLQSLREALSDTETDIHNAVPTAGMRLSIAA